MKKFEFTEFELAHLHKCLKTLIFINAGALKRATKKEDISRISLTMATRLHLLEKLGGI